MTGGKRGIGHRQVEREVGAVTDDGVGRLGCLPGDGDDAEVNRCGHAADRGRHEVSHRGCCAVGAGAVNIARLDGVAMVNLQLPIHRGPTDDRRDRAREGAIVAGRLQNEVFSRRLGRALHQHADGIAGGPGGVEDRELDDAGAV